MSFLRLIMCGFSWRLVIWFRFLLVRNRFFLLYKWFAVFHPANKLMFSSSASDLVHVVVLVINGYGRILPKCISLCLKKVNAGLEKTAKARFSINSFMTNITYNHIPQISFVNFLDIHYFVLELTKYLFKYG